MESASKEALYQQKILELQNDLRQAKTSLSSAQAENDRLSSISLEMREVIFSSTQVYWHLECSFIGMLHSRLFLLFQLTILLDLMSETVVFYLLALR